MRLITAGVIPITAKLAFVPLARATGTLAGGSLTVNAGVRLRVTSAKVLGIELVNGSTCQARLPSLLKLRAATYAPTTGGLLTGTFSISDLQSCGNLTKLISPAIRSTNNPIAIKATPLP